jgi:hypothetical protein
MKNRSILLLLVISLIFSISQLLAQKPNLPDPIKRFVPTLPTVKFYKAGKSFYQQKENWQQIIDSTWGPGDPYGRKMQMFDAYVKALDDNFPCFPNLTFSWDSLKNHHRNEIDSTTSRGRFFAIMGHLAYKLQDLHTYAWDSLVITSPLNPGTPLLLLGGIHTIEYFGAVLTILEDSSIAVLRAVDNHPLNLEPGDVILGYEGVPWKQLVEELLEAELPIVGRWGGAPSAFFDAKMIGAGMNWHLFETIDIKKYSTGEVVSLPTSLMLSLDLVEEDWIWHREQLEIPNIPFPEHTPENSQSVTYGILENTNIGFIYLDDEEFRKADKEFFEAVNALKETDGLIIDMRFNLGGHSFFPEAFDILFNYQRLYTFQYALRCSPNNWDLCPDTLSTMTSLHQFSINANPYTFYEKPIAVLTGPSTVSCGDVTNYRLQYHPNVKVFGKSSSAGTSWGNNYLSGYDGWLIRWGSSDMFRVSDPSNFLNQKEVPVDYPIWFNLDDIANNYDTVLEEAKKYVSNLAQTNNARIDKIYTKNDITFAADVINPNSNDISVTAQLENESEIIDSIDCEIVNESIEETIDLASYPEDIYSVSILTEDKEDSTTHTLPNIVRFTNVGPVEIDTCEVSQINDLNRLRISNISAINQSLTKTIDNVIARFYSEDSFVRKISGIKNFSSLLPQEKKIASGSIYVEVDTIKDYTFIVEISSNNFVYWKDTIEYVHVPVGVKLAEDLPTEYSLSQNYPNPFNPSTTIKYSIPKQSNVTLKVYNVLGSEIATLVNREQPQGYYEVEFDGTQLTSGIYFYRLKAGDPETSSGQVFVETKKMLYLK